MENKLLVKEFPDGCPILSGKVASVASAIERYGEIPTFFTPFNKPIGMEFEIENVDLGPLPTDCPQKLDGSLFWNGIKDGSLRGRSCEFVSNPVFSKGIDYALHELENYLLRTHSPVSSIRTSIHVHCDVSAWDRRTLFYSTALYALLEELFFYTQPESRQYNAYCYRITDLRPDLIGVYPEIKYCAFNLAPVSKQYTVEFRHAAFSTDWRKNRRWIQLVCKFMRFCDMNGSNLRKIIEDTIVYDNYEKLAKTIFGKSMFLFGHEPAGLMAGNAPWAVALLENI